MYSNFPGLVTPKTRPELVASSGYRLRGYQIKQKRPRLILSHIELERHFQPVLMSRIQGHQQQRSGR